MIHFVFTAREGKPNFKPITESLFRQHLLEHEGKTYEIKMREYKRSLSQNNYYRAYVQIIADETGGNPRDLHEVFKKEFLPVKYITVAGKEHQVSGSTTELTKLEMSEYLDKICALTEIPLPDPKEAGYITSYGNYT